MYADIAAVEQAREFGNRGPIQMNSHAELVFAVRAGLQKAAGGEFAEARRCLVGASRSAGEADHHIAVFVGVDVHVGVADVEDGLGIAKLEIDAAAANLNIGNGVAMRGAGLRTMVEQRLNVPGAGRHLDHIDAGRVETRDWRTRGCPRTGWSSGCAPAWTRRARRARCRRLDRRRSGHRPP